MGFYREEADSISLDIQQFVKGEVEHPFLIKLIYYFMSCFLNFYFPHTRFYIMCCIAGRLQL